MYDPKNTVNTIQHNTTQYNTTQCNTMQYNTIISWGHTWTPNKFSTARLTMTNKACLREQYGRRVKMANGNKTLIADALNTPILSHKTKNEFNTLTNSYINFVFHFWSSVDWKVNWEVKNSFCLRGVMRKEGFCRLTSPGHRITIVCFSKDLSRVRSKALNSLVYLQYSTPSARSQFSNNL